jgi:hypothetical protein
MPQSIREPRWSWNTLSPQTETLLLCKCSKWNVDSRRARKRLLV